MSLIRRALLMASDSAWLRERAPRYRFVRRAAARFMPGEALEDALAAAGRLSEHRIASILTHLGENVAGRAEAESLTQQYLGVLDRMRAAGLPAEISVKLTQLGLDFDPEFCFANLAQLLEHSQAGAAADEGANAEKTLWLDMEHSPYVDVTLELYRRARKAYRNAGVCVQAYLYRAERDVETLVSMGAAVRLVKGAYSEPREIAFPKKADVDENYFRLAQMLLGPEARQAGVRAAMATHDRRLIARITSWAAAREIPRNQIEFQMLYGVQRAEQLRLAQEGYRSGVLVSYGSFWFPWFVRRLAERPANILFLARNFFSR